MSSTKTATAAHESKNLHPRLAYTVSQQGHAWLSSIVRRLASTWDVEILHYRAFVSFICHFYLFRQLVFIQNTTVSEVVVSCLNKPADILFHSDATQPFVDATGWKQHMTRVNINNVQFTNVLPISYRFGEFNETIDPFTKFNKWRPIRRFLLPAARHQFMYVLSAIIRLTQSEASSHFVFYLRNNNINSMKHTSKSASHST